jgi:hypothetical protein
MITATIRQVFVERITEVSRSNCMGLENFSDRVEPMGKEWTK